MRSTPRTLAPHEGPLDALHSCAPLAPLRPNEGPRHASPFEILVSSFLSPLCPSHSCAPRLFRRADRSWGGPIAHSGAWPTRSNLTYPLDLRARPPAAAWRTAHQTHITATLPSTDRLWGAPRLTDGAHVGLCKGHAPSVHSALAWCTTPWDPHRPLCTVVPCTQSVAPHVPQVNACDCAQYPVHSPQYTVRSTQDLGNPPYECTVCAVVSPARCTRCGGGPTTLGLRSVLTTCQMARRSARAGACVCSRTRSRTRTFVCAFVYAYIHMMEYLYTHR